MDLYAKCIDITNGGLRVLWPKKDITKGKIYKVIRIEDQTVFIINDSNRETGYYPWRFEIIDYGDKFNKIVNSK